MYFVANLPANRMQRNKWNSVIYRQKTTANVIFLSNSFRLMSSLVDSNNNLHHSGFVETNDLRKRERQENRNPKITQSKTGNWVKAYRDACWSQSRLETIATDWYYTCKAKVKKWYNQWRSALTNLLYRIDKIIAISCCDYIKPASEGLVSHQIAANATRL